MHPGAVIKRFKIGHGLQIIGFCGLWRAVGCPPLDELTASIREQFEAQGMSKSAVYRYLGELRQWNEELGRDPDDVAGLMLEIAGGVLDAEPEKTGASKKWERVLG